MPIIIDITGTGMSFIIDFDFIGRGRLVAHWRPYRKDEDVQRVYEETLSAGYGKNIIPAFFQPNFQRREFQQLWNLEVIELRLVLLWNKRHGGDIWPGRKEEVEPGM